MAFSTQRQAANDYYEFVCDETSDIDTLPTDCQPGSNAFIIASSTVYMLNNQGVWKPLI